MKKFSQLPWREKVVVVQAAVLLCLLRFLVAILPFGRVQRVASWLASSEASLSCKDTLSPSRIGYLVAAAANRIPGTTCIPRAVVAHILLRRHGYNSEIRVGVTKDLEGALAAHAWVEAEGTVVIGGSETSFKPILSTA